MADAEREKLLDRICKLLAKGRDAGCTEAEAQAFVSKAQILMLQHSILEHELGLKTGAKLNYSTKIIYTMVKGASLRKHLFAGIIHREFNVRIVLRKQVNKEIVVEAFGSAENVDTAEYVYHFLLTASQQLYNEYRRTNGHLKHRARLANSYYSGIAEGFERALKDGKIAAEQKAAGMSTALVVIGKELEQAFRTHYTKRKLESSHTRHRAERYGDAYSDGYQRGQKIRISKGITGR